MGNAMNCLIVGASRGLGDALACALPDAGDKAWLLSRSEPQSLARKDGVKRVWIKADLNDAAMPQHLEDALRNEPLDVLVYNAGIWEDTAFSGRYDFGAVPRQQHHEILNVNLGAAIDVVQVALPALRQSNNPKIVLIGSINGLENARAPEVAYNASKFGLRGVAHGLREALRPDRIGVTVLNPGNIGGPNGVPHQDLVNLLRCVVRLDRRSVVKEIDLPAMDDSL